MKLPLIIGEDHDIDFFTDIQDAEQYLEAIDVRNGIFTGYDAEGRLLKIEPYEQWAKISLAEQEPTHANELRDILVYYLRNADIEKLPDNLADLVHIAMNYRAPYKTLAESLLEPFKKLWTKIKGP